nr:lectin 30 kda subunit {N-terminal} [Petromyzon marinus=lampreys, egg, Peptide Partial, 16 aa] [Petromyzon marinus]
WSCTKGCPDAKQCEAT